MSPKRDSFIGEILVDRELVSSELMEQVMAEYEEKGGSLVDRLIAAKAIERTQLWQAVAEEMDLEYLDKIDPDAVDSFPGSGDSHQFCKVQQSAAIGAKCRWGKDSLRQPL